MEITNEMLEDVKALASAEEIIAFAKERGVEMSAEDGAKMYDALHKRGELDDDDLDDVAGGFCLNASSWLGRLILLIFGRLPANRTDGVVSDKNPMNGVPLEKNGSAFTDAMVRGKHKGIDTLGELSNGRNGIITL